MTVLLFLMLAGHAAGAAAALAFPAGGGRRGAAMCARVVQSGSALAYLTSPVTALPGVLAMLLVGGA